ncbi:hypothetical protein LY76DRAFT_328253 [Colletotrichum caudatum]|nr:hypothetical protein LY76DRAFT_328253 [Colletotrichum caudatum]
MSVCVCVCVLYIIVLLSRWSKVPPPANLCIVPMSVLLQVPHPLRFPHYGWSKFTTHRYPYSHYIHNPPLLSAHSWVTFSESLPRSFSLSVPLHEGRLPASNDNLGVVKPNLT